MVGAVYVIYLSVSSLNTVERRSGSQIVCMDPRGLFHLFSICTDRHIKIIQCSKEIISQREKNRAE